MVDKASLEKVRESINIGQRFVLTTHVNPDGDGLGSEAALSNFLCKLGKDVFIYNCSPVPLNYKFLDPENRMIVFEAEIHKEILLTADYIVILDIGDWDRLREVGMTVKDLRIKKICIDHHPPLEKFGDIDLIDTAACSTGEIVYDLIRFCGGSINTRIAEALYASIVTDTGSFKFSNTNARSHMIAAELVEAGAVPQEVYQKIYEQQPVSKVKLLGYVLYNLQIEENGRVAWIQVPKDKLDEIGAKPYDTLGFADYPRLIDGVEVSIIFVELDSDRVKISLRSKGNYVINKIAQKFGGGGHDYAAGVLIQGTLKDYVPKVLEEVAKLFF